MARPSKREPRLCKSRRDFLLKMLKIMENDPKSGIKKGSKYEFDGHGYRIIPPKKRTTTRKRTTQKKTKK